MKNLIHIFTRRSTLWLLAFYVTLSFLLMNLNDPFMIRGLRIGMLQAINWVSRMEHFLDYVRDLKQENRALRRENLQLSLNNQRLQELMLENLRLRRLLGLKRSSPFHFVAANVIGFGQEETVRSLILDVGKEDSIRKNMPVVTEKGLVGKILHVETHQSIAQILLDRHSLVSARLQKSREVGVISWSGNFWLDLNYIPKEVAVNPGEVVITSGLSKIYPPGIKIGIVAEVKQNEYELFKEIKVKPAVNFNNLEQVFVLVKPDSQQVE